MEWIELSLYFLAELVILAGQEGVDNNANDCRNGKTS